MPEELSRRQFLSVAGLSFAGLALRPPPPRFGPAPLGLGRVTVTRIGIYNEPSFHANRLAYVPRDTLLNLLKRVTADHGPPHNPLWYEIADGYVHSGSIQNVRWEPQTPLPSVSEAGAVFEVSVPYTRTYRRPDPASDPLYRLYYQSTAWVVGVERGSDGRLWYRLADDLLPVHYYARAEHLRRIEPSEMAPISPHVPSRAKRIEVSLARQELMAFEYDQMVFRTRISSGIPDPRPRSNGVPTITPKGSFYVDKKMPLRHMGDGRLTANLEAYELPGVPWVSYFYVTGVAFHGTYWHTDYGRPKSHGCINMRPEEAKWLFRWTTPVIEADVKFKAGHGTSVIVY